MHVAHNVFETMGPSSPHFASMRDDMNRSLAWMSMLALPDWGAQHVRTHVELVGDDLEAWEMCKKKPPRQSQQSWDVALLQWEQSLSWKQLMRRTSLPKDDLKRQLFTLEIRGWIRRVPGRAHVRC